MRTSLRFSLSLIPIEHGAGFLLGCSRTRAAAASLRDAATRRLVFARRNVGSAVERRARAASSTLVTALRTACSVGPPTVSDTISPPLLTVFASAQMVIFAYQQNNGAIMPPSRSGSTHHHNEIRICSSLITDAIIRNDEGGARRQ